MTQGSARIIGGGKLSALLPYSGPHLEVFDLLGACDLDTSTFTIPFVAIAVRILVHPNDPFDAAALGALQDRLRV